MTTQQLQHFKQLLLDEQARLKQELADIGVTDTSSLSSLPTYPESGSNSDDDNAAEITEYSDELSVEARLEAELRDNSRALQSIEKGTYGVCKYCKKEIDAKRLEARPSSSSCIECKKLLTQEV